MFRGYFDKLKPVGHRRMGKIRFICCVKHLPICYSGDYSCPISAHLLYDNAQKGHDSGKPYETIDRQCCNPKSKQYAANAPEL